MLNDPRIGHAIALIRSRGHGDHTDRVSPAIVIVDYRTAWPDEFRRLGSRLRDELSDVALRIDHIGSTSVPGLAAKDIQITVESLDCPEIQPALERAGAQPTDIDTDHVPPGMTLDQQELRKRLFVYNPPARRANVHLRQAGRFNQRYALLCRDYLIAHPLAAAAYAEIKRQLARHFVDSIEAYYDVKDPTFDLFMSAARQWADWTDWIPPASNA